MLIETIVSIVLIIYVYAIITVVSRAGGKNCLEKLLVFRYAAKAAGLLRLESAVGDAIGLIVGTTAAV